MILRVIDTSHTTVHSEGRYYLNKSIVNITVLPVHAYFPTNSTIDIVPLMKLPNGRHNAIRSTTSLLERQYMRKKCTLKIIILPMYQYSLSNSITDGPWELRNPASVLMKSLNLPQDT
ncbi:hypothetical protein C922_05157 [Plasmodium inui San Antonio 1]|uniref:Uncharacterized protein n=1 Tax=Plasmodium inui San Antonio 1 TaxID=1237626 RepID=W7A5V5_9APIC|nr:hypothetical protein C922_05157 [Plasmodium inui San Antonio 1]EUD64469.1 hypothetical protein C922_05157 [Plasmodium inui San Antonio 1]